MLLAGLFAGCLFVALVAGDWWRFSRTTAPAGRYGCPVARAEETVPEGAAHRLAARLTPDGFLPLEHGLVRFSPTEQRILLRPRSQFGQARFRTAWPLKAVLELDAGAGSVRVRCVKLMPWSSALLTLLWFAVVGIGTLAFVVRFLTSEDTVTLGSILLGLGVTGVGLLVLAFGLVTVSLAYRLEDHRLMQAYQELRAVLTGDA
ncbi:MAG: hypothetical protein ACREI9_01225 [Nitrospiraceae bacterium]